MPQKIALIVNYNLYETKRHFTEKLAEAFNREGVETQIFDDEKYKRKAQILDDIQLFSADLTCSFNSILPLPDGRLLWDWLVTPHLAFLVDPAIYTMNFLRSPYSIISCVDRNDCAFMKSQTFEHVLFLPHAVESELTYDSKQERPYDVVFFGSCNDYESVRSEWESRFPGTISNILEEAIEQVFSNVPLINALVSAIKAHSFTSNEVDFLTLFSYLDIYTRGRDRVELIRSLDNLNIHIFGESDKGRYDNAHDWEYYVGAQSNVTIHPSIPFIDSFQILKQSKICLNSMPFFKDGTHERIFTGLACGTVPVTSASRYINENFEENKEILTYQPGEWHSLKIKVEELLRNEKKRSGIAQAGREKVMKYHTWDARAKQLIQALPPIITKIQTHSV